MENMSDYLMLGLLLICMRYDEKVYYKVLDNRARKFPIYPHEAKIPVDRQKIPSELQEVFWCGYIETRTSCQNPKPGTKSNFSEKNGP